ncbi:MAG: phosphonate ABC transporter, permease protein PhnE [Deltaproteobacteria bacterium]|nr:phosphonate ABC transporter, permease protein PhnE [Deltaproteobacteria bacterium]
MTLFFKKDLNKSEAYAAFRQTEARLRRAKNMRTIIFVAVFILALWASAHVGEVDIPEFIEGLPGFFNYFQQTLPEIDAPTFREDISDWYWGIDKWLLFLWDTVLIAFLATLFGFISAFMLCFAASRNLNKNYWTYFVCRRILEIARSVPELVYALIFVFSFGIGPFPGVLAIAIHSCGALGKLFSEVNENVDLGATEGVMASGGNWFQMIRYAVVPQVFPNFMSYTLLRFEINVRAASVVGFVGAGGIGQELMTSIRQFLYTDVSAIVLMLVCAVAIIDVSCEKIRHRIIGQEVLV